MGLGLQGAFGLQSGWEALHQIIADRRQQELLAQASHEKQTRDALENARFEEQKRQFDLTNERLSAAEGVTLARQQQQDANAESTRIQNTHQIGDDITPQETATLVKAHDQGALDPRKIFTMPGLIEKLGGTPGMVGASSPDAAPGYAGNTAQIEKAKSDALATQRYNETIKRDDAAAARGNESNRIANARLGIAETNANRPLNVMTVNNDGQLVPVGEAPKGTRIVGNPDKLPASDMQMKNAAKQMLPHIETVRAMAEQLNNMGLFGPAGSRYADFVGGKIGAGELAAGSPQGAQLLGKFQSELKLLKSGAARAHAGARGAGSQHLMDLMDSVASGVADLPTFQGQLDGLKDYMTGYSQLGEPEKPNATPTPDAAPTGGKRSAADILKAHGLRMP